MYHTNDDENKKRKQLCDKIYYMAKKKKSFDKPEKKHFDKKD